MNRVNTGAVGLALPQAALAARKRVRPSDPAWPAATAWQELNRKIDGHLIKSSCAYVSESDYFLRDSQRAYWGTNYPRLQAAKGFTMTG